MVEIDFLRYKTEHDLRVALRTVTECMKCAIKSFEIALKNLLELGSINTNNIMNVTQQISLTFNDFRNILSNYSNAIPPDQFKECVSTLQNEFLRLTDTANESCVQSTNAIVKLSNCATDLIKLLTNFTQLVIIVSGGGIGFIIGHNYEIKFTDKTLSTNWVPDLSDLAALSAAGIFTWLPGMSIWGSLAGPTLAMGIPIVGTIASVPLSVTLIGTCGFYLGRRLCPK